MGNCNGVLDFPSMELLSVTMETAEEHDPEQEAQVPMMAVISSSQEDLSDLMEDAQDMRPRKVASETQLPSNDACCLVWLVEGFDSGSLSDDQLSQLTNLHAEILQCTQLVSADILEDSATSGLILSRPMSSMGMTAEDVAVRLGQLLCQWATLQEPEVVIRVGINRGNLASFSLPSCGRSTFLGSSCNMARNLAMTAERRSMVHISNDVRKNLRSLSGLRMILSRNRETFYTPGPTDALAGYDEDEYVDATVVPAAGGRRRSLSEIVSHGFRPSIETGLLPSPVDQLDSIILDSPRPSEFSKMPVEDFTRFLASHGVNVKLFGTGGFRTIEELHRELTVTQDSYLSVVGNRIERVKEIVRISLFARGADQRLRELRIMSQQTGEGQMRVRNEKLAMVVKVRQDEDWAHTVEKCFELKFGINKAEQKQCFEMDWDGCKVAEDRTPSRTTPLPTVYKSRNIVVHIKDRQLEPLKRIGFPNLEDFSTKRRKDDEMAEYFWTWALVGNSKEDELINLLQANGIDIAAYQPGAVTELYNEVYETSQSSLEQMNGELVRRIRVMKVWLRAEILAVHHVLLSKSKHQRGVVAETDAGRPPSMRIPKGMHWRDAAEAVLVKRIGLDANFLFGSIAIAADTHETTEEVAISRSYPGLKTIYNIDEVTVNIVDTQDPRLKVIGLPEGHQFGFCRQDMAAADSAGGPGPGGLIITHWQWMSDQERKIDLRRMQPRTALDDGAAKPAMQKRQLPAVKPGRDSGAAGVIARLSMTMSAGATTPLERAMKGKTTDWTKAKRAAKRIRDQDYSCKDFWQDITGAFPELELYLTGNMSSGRTADDEYQRTMGAFFAIYWLMRLHLEGSQAFCFGLDDSWIVRAKPPSASPQVEEEWKIRRNFFERTEWSDLEMLLWSAGLLEAPCVSTTNNECRRSSWLAKAKAQKESAPKHNEERTLAMLVLTAIHDIMKNQSILPVVSKKVASYHGYTVGETVTDHDIALSYIMEFHPSVLPSFAGLPKRQQDSLRFTQAKMDYNMGWLVQAEAPPGALLRTFRKVVILGKADPHDVAFYFVHWFTDLAGAEPYPQEGCEKLVLKFPNRVLNQFLTSFSVVQNLSPHKTETETVEDYICWCWNQQRPSLGDPPAGLGSVAKMRLVIMAQGDCADVLRSFDRLPEQDRRTLAKEMAITGCQGQVFKREPQDDSQMGKVGPAILVYYAPALMQKAGRKDPFVAMSVLAEVFRQARSIWPFEAAAANDTVTVRIDSMKDLEPQALVKCEAGTTWVLAKLNNKDGAVQSMTLEEASCLDPNHRILQIKCS